MKLRIELYKLYQNIHAKGILNRRKYTYLRTICRERDALVKGKMDTRTISLKIRTSLDNRDLHLTRTGYDTWQAIDGGGWIRRQKFLMRCQRLLKIFIISKSTAIVIRFYKSVPQVSDFCNFSL